MVFKDVLLATESGCVVLVQLDLTAAFDTVDYPPVSLVWRTGWAFWAVFG